MTQADFIQAIHNDLGPDTKVTKAMIESVIRSAANVTLLALQQGDDAPVANLGKFRVTERAARKGRNPRTGVSIEISAKKGVKFIAKKAMKDAIN